MIKNILISGGAGFIGTHLCPYFCQRYKDLFFINIDKLTYASNVEQLALLPKYSNYKFIKGDIADQELLSSIFQDYAIDAVINLAAESHVDNGIKAPQPFIDSNIYGTFNLLQTAYRYWMNDPFKYKKKYARFHQVSTDEIYGSIKQGFAREGRAMRPRNPYAASKASADLLVNAYATTYGLNITRSIACNNFGPYQHTEKFIPTIILHSLKHQKIPLYGDGLNIRNWIYVLDHILAIETIFFHGKSGQSYHVGTKKYLTNIELIHIIHKILNKHRPFNYSSLIQYVDDRPGHDRRYALNSDKIKRLFWRESAPFLQRMEETVLTYMQYI